MDLQALGALTVVGGVVVAAWPTSGGSAFTSVRPRLLGSPSLLSLPWLKTLPCECTTDITTASVSTSQCLHRLVVTGTTSRWDIMRMVLQCLDLVVLTTG